MRNKHIILILSGFWFMSTSAQSKSRTLGNKSYEVSNHLNNVMTVVSDRKTPIQESSSTIIAFAETDIISFSDYYPYGMLLDNRNESISYRYGFQGQEKDDEVKGANNSINYKYRVHDPRLGRFFAVDPLFKKYPFNSQYAFSENLLIHAREIEGLEAELINYSEFDSSGEQKQSSTYDSQKDNPDNSYLLPFDSKISNYGVDTKNGWVSFPEGSVVNIYKEDNELKISIQTANKGISDNTVETEKRIIRRKINEGLFKMQKAKTDKFKTSFSEIGFASMFVSTEEELENLMEGEDKIVRYLGDWASKNIPVAKGLIKLQAGINGERYDIINDEFIELELYEKNINIVTGAIDIVSPFRTTTSITSGVNSINKDQALFNQFLKGVKKNTRDQIIKEAINKGLKK